MSKLAVFFPGMGYTHDKPLLYYSRKLAADSGYDAICVEYHDLPDKIRGNKDKMLLAASMAYEQSCEFLASVDFGAYEEVLFVGKSIGTIMATKYAEESSIKTRMLLYTPLEATFGFDIKDAVAFIGEADPWSDLEQVKVLAVKSDVPLHTYPGCNHSLECADGVMKNIEILEKVMKISGEYVVGKGVI